VPEKFQDFDKGDLLEKVTLLHMGCRVVNRPSCFYKNDTQTFAFSEKEIKHTTLHATFKLTRFAMAVKPHLINSVINNAQKTEMKGYRHIANV
jgi:hypothetical protein